ncbi:MAG TPA: GNAT family N-acetyltransferase [Solirubrobacteraceae bacterium]|nr:GNAT family N-acetyltransferase [Solirubrobacteraceae bacterium]
MITGVDHVQVAAPPGSEDAARAFYGGLLGMQEIRKPERLLGRGGVWFRAGDQELHVGIEKDFKPAWKAHPALAVSQAHELRVLAHHLDAAGHDVRWDGPRFYVSDPFGNRLELIAPHGDVQVRRLREDEREWAAAVLRAAWGSDIIAYGDGRRHRPAQLPAILAEVEDERAGLATYAIDGDRCELVTLNALTVGAGIGGALVEAVADAARAHGCTRVRVTTTNDNFPALRLYQRHGFVLDALLPRAVEIARGTKPEISATGVAGIPIRDELELERAL